MEKVGKEGVITIEVASGVEFELDVVEGMMTPTAEQRAITADMCRNLLYDAMKQDEHRSALRTIHVMALIHAGMRWDKSRNFKANDWYDFGHATVAFTYCDAFFTEKPLHHLVTRPQLGLETINGCKVASNVEEALAIVRGLRESIGRGSPVG